MKTTFQMQVGGKDDVKVVIHEGNLTLGALKVTGRGVAWEAGTRTREFSWEAWLMMIDQRTA